jgi:phosphoribosylformimino-5-aminoimidazole carboxamide ribotide isomerase
MIIIPAIDLIDGKCVRLTEGDFNQKKIYDENPIKVAKHFKELGVKTIHIIDLDGAKSGKSINRQIIKQIKEETKLIIETGGGIRTDDDVAELIDANIDYLILGTILIENIDLVKKWIGKFEGRFIAGIDVKNDIIQTRGWLNQSGINSIEFGRKLFQMGFKTAIYTDISKDGKMAGPNIESSKEFSVETGLKLILSGGVSSESDIIAAKTLTYYGLTGIIIGKAYYEGKINLAEVLKKYQE